MNFSGYQYNRSKEFLQKQAKLFIQWNLPFNILSTVKNVIIKFNILSTLKDIIIEYTASCKIAWYSQLCYFRESESRNLTRGWVNNKNFTMNFPTQTIRIPEIKWKLLKNEESHYAFSFLGTMDGMVWGSKFWR